MPVPLRWEHVPSLRIPGTGSPAPPLLSRSGHIMSVRAAVGCQSGIHQTQTVQKLRSGSKGTADPGNAGADAVPEQLEHRGLHLPVLSPHQSYVFSYTWTGIPDNVWSPLHRGHPVPAKIFPEPDTPAIPTILCRGTSTSIFFQVMNPLHLLPLICFGSLVSYSMTAFLIF